MVRKKEERSKDRRGRAARSEDRPQREGIALLHAMKQQNLAVPMVLLTGHPQSKELEDLRTLGLAGWLPKPPDLVNLSLLLVQALSG